MNWKNLSADDADEHGWKCGRIPWVKDFSTCKDFMTFFESKTSFFFICAYLRHLRMNLFHPGL